LFPYTTVFRSVPGAVFRLLAGEDRVPLDLHPPPLVEQAGDDHHGGGRPHVAHRPGVSATHRSGHGRVGDIHPGTDHMVEAGTQLTEGRADDLEAAVALHLRVGITAAVGPAWSRARHVDQVAVAHRPAEPDLPLIWGAGGDMSAHPGTIPTLCGGPGRALTIAQGVTGLCHPWLPGRRLAAAGPQVPCGYGWTGPLSSAGPTTRHACSIMSSRAKRSGAPSMASASSFS